ncbi:MAG TPA: DUF5691 domain-containing protein, partial [Flavisolibacter sp.]|nr:DUF5691 domain-containing protein [Flavisolibacter sp.]
MESWNHIINTALLGTEKRELKRGDLSSDLPEYFDVIVEQAESKEDAFLQTASVLYNVRQCGFTPMHKGGISISKADEEEKQYANELAHRVLYDILETTSTSLFHFWLEQCAQANRIVQPETIPLLFDKGMKNKSIRPLIYDCCGKRGAWLLQFNPAWKYVDTSTDEDLWQIGVLEQRKNILAELRRTDPVKARELLQQTWTQENAAAKTELLQQLRTNANENDLLFLEEILNEKSVKVKEAALQILKTISSSSIVQSYWKVIAPSIELKKERSLLGLSSKTVLNFIPVKEIDESIYKTGIEKLSSDKKILDQDYLLYQLLSSIPPYFLEQYTDLPKEEVLKAIHYSSNGKYFISAITRSAIRFHDVDWLRAVIALQDQVFYPEAVVVLPQKEAEQYSLKHFDGDNAHPIINALGDFEQEWSLELT